MKNRTYLAFDYGTKRIGVAIGSTETGTAQALDTVAVHRSGPDWQHISRLIDEWRPDALVVGLPLNMDSTECEITPLARKFGRQLEGRYNLSLHMVDERLTSRSAIDSLLAAGVPGRRIRKSVDRMAAQHILETFLNERAEG